MAGLNRVEVIGNLGKDPELHYTPAGDAVCSFSVAVSEKWKDKAGEAKEQTEWFNVVAWRKLGEICNQYLTKGSKVFISGKQQTRSWDDKETGVKKWRTELVLSGPDAKMVMLGAPKPKASASAEFDGPSGYDSGASDDLPF